MFVTTIPNRNSPPAILVRESYRKDGKVHSRTLANVSKLPAEAIEALRLSLKGKTLVPVDEAFEIDRSFFHGEVKAVLQAMRRLKLSNLIAARGSKERDLVVAMVVARILKADSKLATTRWWQDTTLPTELDVADADEDHLYSAMDWLLERQSHIEKKLARRHLAEGGLALWDLTSSYFEGVTCPIAKLGHNRDGKKGKLQVNYGVLTDERGCPVSISVFDGNTGDPKTLQPQVEKIRKSFGLQRFVMVGDRGMITAKQVENLRDLEGVDWITALRPGAIRALTESGAIQMGLFDDRDLFEIRHVDYPGERLVACRNPFLAKRRADKRKSLLESTERELEKVRTMVTRRLLSGRGAIGQRIDSILMGYRIRKFYRIKVRDDGFDCEVDWDDLKAMVEGDGEGDPQVIEKRLARYKRHSQSIAKKLEMVTKSIIKGRLHGCSAIGIRVGKTINKYKVGKHFKLTITDNSFELETDQPKVRAEAALDGVYVIRTSLPKEELAAEDTVRCYKLLGQVERVFRTFKGIDILVRPIHHHLEKRVRAHLFLCMLAYYVVWHMIEVWRPLLFCDEDLEAKRTRDPVAPARRSDAALRKVHSKKLKDGSVVHSLRTLLEHLKTIVRNVCRVPGTGANSPTFDVFTTPDEKQQQAFDLLDGIKV